LRGRGYFGRRTGALRLAQHIQEIGGEMKV
jgi:hypothetical protein